MILKANKTMTKKKSLLKCTEFKIKEMIKDHKDFGVN